MALFCLFCVVFCLSLAVLFRIYIHQAALPILLGIKAIIIEMKTLFYSLFYGYLSELGTSLFEIALSLFALERTLILRAMALLETKSEAL